MIYPAVLSPFSDGSGGFVVEFPDLPGCVTEGKNLEEAILMGTDAASGWILAELENGNRIPEASQYHEVHAKDGGIVSLFALDIKAYAEKYGEKSVRKNLTILVWLNTYVEKKQNKLLKSIARGFAPDGKKQ